MCSYLCMHLLVCWIAASRILLENWKLSCYSIIQCFLHRRVHIYIYYVLQNKTFRQTILNLQNVFLALLSPSLYFTLSVTLSSTNLCSDPNVVQACSKFHFPLHEYKLSGSYDRKARWMFNIGIQKHKNVSLFAQIKCMDSWWWWVSWKNTTKTMKMLKKNVEQFFFSTCCPNQTL